MHILRLDHATINTADLMDSVRIARGKGNAATRCCASGSRSRQRS